MPKFSVHYTGHDPDLADTGDDTVDMGVISEGGSLRDAIADLLAVPFNGDYIDARTVEASAWPESYADWVTVDHGAELHSGIRHVRTLHWPRYIGEHSKARLLRLIKARA